MRVLALLGQGVYVRSLASARTWRGAGLEPTPQLLGNVLDVVQVTEIELQDLQRCRKPGCLARVLDLLVVMDGDAVAPRGALCTLKYLHGGGAACYGACCNDNVRATLRQVVHRGFADAGVAPSDEKHLATEVTLPGWATCKAETL